jgi:GNAT superfamily N-acetyltransferase
MTDIALVRTLEERLFNAWPALQTVYCDGWLLRMAGGHTKRSNAASPFYPSSISGEELIHTVRTLYRKAGIEPMVRITPLAGEGIDAALASAGWTVYDETDVMVASLADRVKMTGATDAAVVLSEEPSQAWIDGAAGAYELADWQRDMLARIVGAIRVETAFATVYVDKQAVGFGLAVADRGYVGLYDLAVTPAARGSGAGQRMIGALLHWGRSHGAHTAYLQVRKTNVKAHALYTRLGFTLGYDYHCRRMAQTG